MATETFEFKTTGDDHERDLEVAQTQHLPDWSNNKTMSVVGHPVPRVDANDKVTGKAVYTSDIKLPGMLYAGVLRCPLAHANVRSINIRKAQQIPGVATIITGRLTDSAGEEIQWYEEASPILTTTARFQGDEVAAVAADSPESVERALAAIEIEYAPLQALTCLGQAIRTEAPIVHSSPCQPCPDTYQRGDIGHGFEMADVIVSETYQTQTALHQPMEAHATIADWRPNELLVYESTQGIHAVRRQIARTFGLPLSRVRVICEHMGGGFGAKQVAWKQTVLAIALSRETARPVRLVLDRRAECLAAGNRNATRQQVKIGATRAGKITAIEVQAEVQGGAYTIGGESSNVVGIFQHLYQCENVSTRQQRFHTSTGPAVAFRAPGYVEGCFALESAIDQLANSLVMDPLALRQMNYASTDQTGNKPWSSPKALAQCYEQIELARTEMLKRRVSGQTRSPRRRGIGIAANEWLAGSGSPPAYAWIRLNADGSAELVTGTQDIGTGTRTVMAQAVAEELCIDPDRVTVRLGDTGTGPFSPTSAGSYTVPTMIPAVRAAAIDTRTQLLAAAASFLDCPVSRLDLIPGRIQSSGDEAGINLEDLLSALAPHSIQGHGARNANTTETSIRPFGAQCAEVEVNIETGEITVLQVVCTTDSGRVMNPSLAASQVLGGVAQGVGFALTEQRIVDHQTGNVLNANLEDYLIPTIADVPHTVHRPIDIPDLNANPAGVKGLGELPVIPAAPAICNAIFDASGVRIRSLPVSRRAFLNELHRLEC